MSRIIERYRLPEKIVLDLHPAVLLSVLMRKDCTGQDLNRISVHIREESERQKGRERDDRYDGVLKHIVAILNPRIPQIPVKNIAPTILSAKADMQVVLGMLRKCDPSVRILPEGWHAYAKHWSPKVRRAVASHENCPDEILRSFLTDTNWLVYLRAWWKIVFKT